MRNLLNQSCMSQASVVSKVLSKNLSKQGFINKLVGLTKKYQNFIMTKGNRRNNPVSISTGLNMNFQLFKNELVAQIEKQRCSFNEDMMELLIQLVQIINEMVEEESAMESVNNSMLDQTIRSQGHNIDSVIFNNHNLQVIMENQNEREP
jgi:hypothetical protein